MKPPSFSQRALIATLLPTIVVALMLAMIFLFGRVTDLDRVHEQRAIALAKQLAASAEFPLFVGNREHLAAQAALVGHEPGVMGVAILDAAGRPLTTSGQALELAAPLAPVTDSVVDRRGDGTTRLLVPILWHAVDMEDWYLPERAPAMQVLGHVVLQLSSSHRDEEVAHLLATSMLIVLAGLIFGVVLATRLSHGVTKPISQIARVVARIAEGDLRARVDPTCLGSSKTLGEGINRMAEHLEAARANLEQRIAAATDALRAKRDEAEQATLAKSRVLASASHDLRQPLHALGMFVARLRQLKHDPETLAVVDHMERSVDAMQGLLNALLDLSRLDAGTQTAEIRPVQVANLLRRLMLDLAPRAAERLLQLRTRLPDTWVMSDPELLYRILLNLTANAVEHTLKGGVMVACRRRGLDLRIEVWDTGVGIAASQLKEIFKEFVQLDNPARDRRKGLGLGLAIVDRTVRLLGHRLDVCSLPGRGSRFAIEVPCCPAERPFEDRRQSTRGVQCSLAGARVLVVDDDPASREAMFLLLAGWGCRVDMLPDYVLAPLPAIPDAVVCDFRLPGPLNGIEVIGALRLACGRAIPACVVSGDTDPTLIHLAADAELPLLHKPVRAGRLEAVLRRLLHRAES